MGDSFASLWGAYNWNLGAYSQQQYTAQQQQAQMQNAYSQYAQSVQVATGVSSCLQGSAKIAKPRRDCPSCGAPWLETCNYCGRGD